MRTQELQSADGVFERVRPDGITRVMKRTAPTNAQPGFAIGCLWTNMAGTVGGILYLNVGTTTSATWLNIG